MLTIENFDKIKGMVIQTLHAHWIIHNVSENELAYCISIGFNYGNTFGKKHPKEVKFYLNRNCPEGMNEYLLQNTYYPQSIDVRISKKELKLKALFIKRLKDILDKI